MLSEEAASGMLPVEAVRVVRQTVEEAVTALDTMLPIRRDAPTSPQRHRSVKTGVVGEACVETKLCGSTVHSSDPCSSRVATFAGSSREVLLTQRPFVQSSVGMVTVLAQIIQIVLGNLRRSIGPRGGALLNSTVQSFVVDGFLGHLGITTLSYLKGERRMDFTIAYGRVREASTARL